MSKISCSIIRDLMVLYEDDVCSEDSRKLIEEHISSCAECHKLYEQTRKKIPPITLSDDEQADTNVDSAPSEEKERASRALKKLKMKFTYKHIIITGITILCLMIASLIWTEHLQYQINRVPTEDVQVSELYELENGDIYCTVKCKNAISHLQLSDIIVPEAKRKQDYDDGTYTVRFQYSLPFENKYNKVTYGDKISIIFPKEHEDSKTGIWYGDEEGVIYPDCPFTHTATSIYFEGKNKEDRLLIWEDGQAIEKAPESIEKRARNTMNETFKTENSRYPYYVPKPLNVPAQD